MKPHSGIRWTLSQLIMQRAQYNLKNPIDMVYHVQVKMILHRIILFSKICLVDVTFKCCCSQ